MHVERLAAVLVESNSQSIDILLDAAGDVLVAEATRQIVTPPDRQRTLGRLDTIVVIAVR